MNTQTNEASNNEAHALDAMAAALNAPSAGGAHAHGTASRTGRAVPTHAALAECPYTGTRFTLTMPYAVTGANAARSGQPVLQVQNPLLDAVVLRASAVQFPAYWHAMRAVYALSECALPGSTVAALRWRGALREDTVAAQKWSVLAEWAARAYGVLASADAESGCTALKMRAGRFTAFAIAETAERHDARGTVESLLQWCCDVCSVADHGIPGCYEPTASSERMAALQAQARAVFDDAKANAAERAADVAAALERKRSVVRTLSEAISAVCDTLEDLPSAQWDRSHSALLASTTNRKLLHGAATLQKLHSRIAECFPDAHFVGDRLAACEEMVLQHLCTVMLEQAARLRAYAVTDDELAEAEGLEAAATADALQTPAGKFYAVPVRKEGVAPAVAEKLQSALVKSQQLQRLQDAADAVANDPQAALERMRDALRALKSGN